MSAQRFTPEMIRSRKWSYAALRRLAADCRDPIEAQAILDAFWAKVDGDPQEKGRETFRFFIAAYEMLAAHKAAVDAQVP